MLEAAMFMNRLLSIQLQCTLKEGTTFWEPVPVLFHGYLLPCLEKALLFHR